METGQELFSENAKNDFFGQESKMVKYLYLGKNSKSHKKYI